MEIDCANLLPIVQAPSVTWLFDKTANCEVTPFRRMVMSKSREVFVFYLLYGFSGVGWIRGHWHKRRSLGGSLRTESCPSGQSARIHISARRSAQLSGATSHRPPSKLVLFSARCWFCCPPSLSNGSEQRVTRYTLLGKSCYMWIIKKYKGLSLSVFSCCL